MNKTRDIVIYGAGGFGRETALLINEINAVRNEWNLLGFIDDGLPKGKVVDGLSVLGSSEILKTNRYAVALAIADPKIRKAKYLQLKALQLEFPQLIHPTARLGDRSRNKIGEGVIINAMNILTTNVIIQDFVVVNLACTLGHDVTLGAFTSIMPMTAVSGFVTVGEEVLIGTGARILPSLTLGNRSVVGAGAVVTKNVGEGQTVMGVPAR